MSRRNDERERGKINKLGIMRKEMERMQKEEMERMQKEQEEMERMRKEEMERMQQKKQEEMVVNRGLPTNGGRGPGRWNTPRERFDMLAARESPIPEYVPGPASVPEPEITQEQRIRAHIQYMQDLKNRRPPPPPPQYTDPSNYSYRVREEAINFPHGHDYTRLEARPVISLSDQARKYEESEVLNANLEELGNRMFHNVMDGQGGRKKRKTANIRQKKQHRRRHRRRHSTKKYRKY